jgi:hypothetical protein
MNFWIPLKVIVSKTHPRLQKFVDWCVHSIYHCNYCLFAYQTAIQFPLVDKYDNHWPVRDILKPHLKYTSEIYRKQEQVGPLTKKNQAKSRFK